jgi:hypothetical protein
MVERLYQLRVRSRYRGFSDGIRTECDTEDYQGIGYVPDCYTPA